MMGMNDGLWPEKVFMASEILCLAWEIYIGMPKIIFIYFFLQRDILSSHLNTFIVR